MVKHTRPFPTAFTVLLLAACGGGDATENKDMDLSEGQRDAVEEAVDCDPLVGEYRDLMAEYVDGLQAMVDAGEVDQDRIESWNDRGNELRDKIEERGERSLGMKCWQEFHTIGSAYAPRIAELGMQVAMQQMKQQGMDPEAMEQLQKAAEAARQ